MVYKGKHIEDRMYVQREKKFYEYDSNCEEFDISDIAGWVDDVKKKEEELREKGVDFKDVRIQISADGYRCNNNGPDDDSYMTIGVTWMEMETELERERRIEKEKKWIDNELKAREIEKMEKAAAQKREIEHAKKVLESKGYKVI